MDGASSLHGLVSITWNGWLGIRPFTGGVGLAQWTWWWWFGPRGVCRGIDLVALVGWAGALNGKRGHHVCGYGGAMEWLGAVGKWLSGGVSFGWHGGCGIGLLAVGFGLEGW